MNGLIGGIVQGGLRGGKEGTIVGREKGGGSVEEGIDVVDIIDPGVDAIEDLLGGWVALLDAARFAEGCVGRVGGGCCCGQSSQGSKAGEDGCVMHFVGFAQDLFGLNWRVESGYRKDYAERLL